MPGITIAAVEKAVAKHATLNNLGDPAGVQELREIVASELGCSIEDIEQWLSHAIKKQKKEMQDVLLSISENC
jgi:hypothetical protein